jgi:hypothetical protein
MKLTDILKEIDTRLPNTLPAEVIIGFLNHTVRAIYIYCGETRTYETNAAKEVLLPEYIKGDLIKSVYAGDEAYLNLKKAPGGRSTYTVNDENILILNPKADGALTISYTPYSLFKTLSEVLSEDTEDDKVKLYEDQTGGICDAFSELLVLGALYRAAEAEEDVTLSNNFRASYEELKRQAMGQRYQKGCYPITKIVR